MICDMRVVRYFILLRCMRRHKLGPDFSFIELSRAVTVSVICTIAKLKSQYEPPRDKTNNVAVRPAKTQISMGIHPVWSESSLCTQWVAKDSSFLHADSEDWSDWADAQPDLSLRWAHTHFVGFVMRRLISKWHNSLTWKHPFRKLCIECALPKLF